ncbi:hypothetical protein SAMN04488543_0074 [Friedmanniella luteola]|uniref:Uncharacterized protein n=1 Tax=Friedmanniella luteola TaxID=546871 RepID=A0A1H1L4L4_9ACTN|nr:hypothetical protein [Friedmanniella luteola]SDR69433.1 hypothetical protein SAMN04488543_0074 [Friedmanniella luteola]
MSTRVGLQGRLEAENRTLRHQLEAQPPTGGGGRGARRRRGRGWTVLAAALVVLGPADHGDGGSQAEAVD